MHEPVGTGVFSDSHDHGNGSWRELGIDIHPGAKIGSHFTIDHGTGVVIGATSIIGNNVKLYQGVTLRAKSFLLDADGKPIAVSRHPILKTMSVHSNATILGRITIGSDATRRKYLGNGKHLPEQRLYKQKQRNKINKLYMSEQFEMIAKTFQGLEEILAEELTTLGANDIQIDVVWFHYRRCCKDVQGKFLPPYCYPHSKTDQEFYGKGC